MPQTALYVGENDGNTIYRIGQVGVDSGSSVGLDAGSTSYTGALKSERISPTGEGGLSRFRRVALRVLRSGPAQFRMRVWVDDEQTEIYDNDVTGSPEVGQEVVFSLDSVPLQEDVVEVSLDATGTFIQVELEIRSGNIPGLFLPESIETHFYPIRMTEARDGEDVQSQ